MIQSFEERLRRIVDMLREAGAREVHVRIASPEIKFPCFYGVDFSTYDELVAATHTTDQICELIGADSLAFVSVDGLTRVLDIDSTNLEELWSMRGLL